jgi:cytochrome b561
MGMPWLMTGALLIAAFVAQALWGWRWEWLAGLQTNELYKQLTGLALVLFFIMQWRLSVARMGSASPAARLLTLHRDQGALAPLLLYLHALSFGHAYPRVMSLAFLGLVALGLLQRPLAGLKSQRANTAWLVVHVTLAAALPFLIGYHAFNAFYYE